MHAIVLTWLTSGEMYELVFLSMSFGLAIGFILGLLYNLHR